jgi:hypothetical protein
MLTIAICILGALAAFSVIALFAAKVFLKKSWRDTVAWLFEFFS